MFGVSETGKQRTSEVLRYNIVKGAITEGSKPSDPTPDIYTQILAEFLRFENEITARMDEFTQNINTAWFDYQAAMGQQQNNFENALTNRVTDFETAMSARQDVYEADINDQWHNFKTGGDFVLKTDYAVDHEAMDTELKNIVKVAQTAATTARRRLTIEMIASSQTWIAPKATNQEFFVIGVGGGGGGGNGTYTKSYSQGGGGGGGYIARNQLIIPEGESVLITCGAGGSAGKAGGASTFGSYLTANGGQGGGHGDGSASYQKAGNGGNGGAGGGAGYDVRNSRIGGNGSDYGGGGGVYEGTPGTGGTYGAAGNSKSFPSTFPALYELEMHLFLAVLSNNSIPSGTTSGGNGFFGPGGESDYNAGAGGGNYGSAGGNGETGGGGGGGLLAPGGAGGNQGSNSRTNGGGGGGGIFPGSPGGWNGNGTAAGGNGGSGGFYIVYYCEED